MLAPCNSNNRFLQSAGTHSLTGHLILKAKVDLKFTKMLKLPQKIPFSTQCEPILLISKLYIYSRIVLTRKICIGFLGIAVFCYKLLYSNVTSDI